MANGSNFEFGPFRIDAEQGALFRNDQPIALPPKDLGVLLVLVQNCGRIVTKEQLLAEVWPNSVIEEGNLARHIFNLRQALGDGENDTRHIETIPKRGYRFVAAVKTDPATPNNAVAMPVQKNHSRRGIYLTAALTVIAVLAGAGYFAFDGWQTANARREARAKALVDIAALIKKDQYGAAFTLAYPWIQAGNADPELTHLWHQVVLRIEPDVSEAGATVYFKPYNDFEGPWVLAGVTPFAKPVDAPRGPLRLKIEKPGFRTGYFVVSNPGLSLKSTAYPGARGVRPLTVSIPLTLSADASLPNEFVLVPHTDIPVILTGWATDFYARGERHDIPQFAIARTEVSNREFKEFVDAGGYDNPTYWEGLKFENGGRALSWNEARALFVDATHRPGPAGWRLSVYPEGQANFPVGGVSWYEAVAYARYRKLQLPTVHHWVRAAFTPNNAIFPTAQAISAHSRIRAATPVPVDTELAFGPWGTINTSGNVREWIWNFADGKALALGGAWTDPYGQYDHAYTTEPMNRSLEHGIRLMKNMDESPLPPKLLGPIHLVFDEPDVTREPVSSEAFTAMRFQFTATVPTPSEVLVTEVKRSDLWIAEEVELKFVDADSFFLYIMRPRNAKGRLHPVIYARGADCCDRLQPNRSSLDFLPEDIVLAGRALVLPIWQGSYERYTGPLSTDSKVATDRQRVRALDWHKDLVTALNYIETRQDMDIERTAFYGLSYGAMVIAPIAAAIEPRIKVVIFEACGLIHFQRLHPMLDAVNYLPRITIPALLIAGRFDHQMPLEKSQKRFFNLLGTPADKKSHVILDTAHGTRAAPNVVATVTTDWLDRYLGPVK